ncbi:hypothetical protein DSO57_1039381 [Entomophthora muscae]|uniref:Uncharacterized protein n=1 Tax=Entomophthora muscae TaxID=34485 RepID=A0ACC2SMM7_9FUNG|nr:hypothetical protein DSO57_1039381 [Entomophthora muscae]
MEVKAKPSERSWFSGTYSAVTSSSQSQDWSPHGSSQLQLAILNKPVEMNEAPVVSAPESLLAMLQHIVPAKPFAVKSKELPLVPIDCDHPVLPVAVQEMIEQYFQEHPASLAAVCTTEEKQYPLREGAKLTKFGSHPGKTNHQDAAQWSTGIDNLERGPKRGRRGHLREVHIQPHQH